MWQSLYLYFDEGAASSDDESSHDDASSTSQTPITAVEAALAEALTAAGYHRFNPFGPVPGRSYPQTLRTFIAPLAAGWARIIAEGGLPDAVVEHVSKTLADHPCVSLALNGNDALVNVYHGGDVQPLPDALTPYLRPDQSPQTLDHALNAPLSSVAPAPDDADAVPLSALPEDVQAMAQKLNPRQINKMFNKWMGRVSKQLGGDAEGARDLLKGSAPDWHSAGGTRLRAVVACLTLPDPGWRTPDFISLRDAYQVHSRRERNPNANLYPGDAEAMQTVPDALAYVPVYAGKEM